MVNIPDERKQLEEALENKKFSTSNSKFEMIRNIFPKISVGFNLFCISAAVALSGYWIYVYTLNEDLTNVDNKKYYAKEKDVFPGISMCLTDTISEEKLRRLIPDINSSSYLSFIKGDEFDSSMLSIKYSEIVKNMNNYIEEDFIRYRNGSYISLHPDYHGDSDYGSNVVMNSGKRSFPAKYSFFSLSKFYNCYELSTPHDRKISAIYFRIKNSIFPSGIRPQLYGFILVAHFPNQLLISNKRINQWKQPRYANDSYMMDFFIEGVEILRRRKKLDTPCNGNWEYHDYYIMKEYGKSFGCRPPYLDYIKEVPLCTLKEQLKEKFYFREDHYGLNPPCKEMIKISLDYHENTLDPTTISWARKGFFWLGIHFPSEDFKEISQTR